MRNAVLPILILSLIFISPAFAQENAQIEIIFDASNSMNEASGSLTKMDVAKQALTTLAGQIAQGSQVGLRVFGHKPVQNNIRESCTDSELLLPMSAFQSDDMVSRVLPLKSYGMTALGYSLELAASDFTPDAKKTIILISDGEESCGKDPAQVMEALKARGINVVIHAVGFAANAQAQGQLKKLAEMTQGSYTDAQNAGELQASLQQAAEKSNVLLGIQRGEGQNILAASEGTRIVSSSTQEFAKMIDGSEASTSGIGIGQEVVFSFKENQAVSLEKFAVPVFEVGNYNPGELTLNGSTESPDLGFFPIGKFKLENKVIFGNVYQEFKIDPPVAIKYLKIVVGVGSGGSQSYHTEWKAYGKYLSDAEFAEALKSAPKREMNILAAEYGGQLIASSNASFEKLIDGKSGAQGEGASIKPNEEGIFGFRGGKTALIKKVAMPINEGSTYNCKTVEFYASTTTPTGEYTKIGAFATMNMVFAGNPYQEYAFEQPVKAKYLKIKVIDTHGMYYCILHELQAYGELE